MARLPAGVCSPTTLQIWATFSSHLTIELSGRPPPPLRIGEHAIHCEHDVPTMNHGSLQLVGRQHSHRPKYAEITALCVSGLPSIVAGCHFDCTASLSKYSP